MNPQNWSYAPECLEIKLQNYIEWYDLCQKAIETKNSSIARQLKAIFLNTVNINDISDYLAYYRPFSLNVNKLIRIEEEILRSLEVNRGGEEDAVTSCKEEVGRNAPTCKEEEEEATSCCKEEVRRKECGYM